MRRRFVRTGSVILALGAVFSSTFESAAGPPEIVWRVDRPGMVFDFEITPDSTRIVQAAGDGHWKVWNCLTGELEREVRVRPAGWFGCLALSPDGQIVLTAGDTPELRTPRLQLWRLEDGSPLRALNNTFEYFTDADFSRDGALVAASPGGENDCCDGDGMVVYDVATGKLVRQWPMVIGESVAFSPDSEMLALGTRGLVRIYRISDGALLRSIESAWSPAEYSVDGSILATSSAAGTILLWQTSDYTLVGELPGNGNDVRSIDFSGDGEMIAAGFSDFQNRAGHTRVWRLSDQQLVHHFDADSVSVVAKFNPTSSEIFEGTYDAFRRRSVENGKVRWSIEGPPSGAQVNPVFHPDGSSFAMIDRADESLNIHAADGVLLRTFEFAPRRPACVAYSPDGSSLAVGTVRGSNGDATAVFLLNSETGKIVREFTTADASVAGVAFSSEGAQLAAAFWRNDNTGGLQVWNIADGKILHSEDSDRVNDVAYSPDGELLATAHEEGMAILRRASDFEVVHVLEQIEDHGATSLAFSPDGALLTVSSMYSVLSIWDTTTGKLVFRDDEPSFNAVVEFAPDGRSVMVGTPISRIRFYRVPGFERVLEYEEAVSTLPSSIAFAPHSNSFIHGRQAAFFMARNPLAPCRADWNLDGSLNSSDFFEFLNEFYRPSTPLLAPPDFNRDGATNSQDFFDFLTAFFSGC